MKVEIYESPERIKSDAKQQGRIYVSKADEGQTIVLCTTGTHFHGEGSFGGVVLYSDDPEAKIGSFGRYSVRSFKLFEGTIQLIESEKENNIDL